MALSGFFGNAQAVLPWSLATARYNLLIAASWRTAIIRCLALSYGCLYPMTLLSEENSCASC